MIRSKLGILGIGAVIGLALMLISWRFINLPYTYQGSIIEPPIPAADFQLMDQNGEPYRLADRRGNVVLIFFGYTNCPDVCPVTLSQMKNIKAQLGQEAEKIDFVFVTVDPERDTTERLQKYLANFEAGVTGLTGTRIELEQVWKDYGVYQQKVEAGSAAGYLVDHTARIYVIDAAGNWRLTFPFGMETDAIVADIAHLLKQG